MKNWVIGALLVLLGIAAYYYFSVYLPAESPVAVLPTAPAVVPEPEPVPEPVPLPATIESKAQSR